MANILTHMKENKGPERRREPKKGNSHRLSGLVSNRPGIGYASIEAPQSIEGQAFFFIVLKAKAVHARYINNLFPSRT